MSNKPLQIRLQLNADGNVRKVVQGVNGDLGTLESQTNKAGLAIKRMGHYAVGAMAGYLSIGAMKQVVNQVGQFESAMLSLRAVSSATESQVKSLERQARDLGATSVFSAQQAAQAQTFLAQAGFSVNEVLDATPGLLQLAVAGNLDLARAADIASNVLGGMRLEVDELNRVNDVLAKTAASSNTNIQQLGDAFSYAAPFAAGAGIEIEEAAAAIGILSDNGLQASRAGTGMIGMIRQLSTFTPQAESVLAKYGLTVADVDIKTHGFAEVMRRLQPVGKNTGDVIKVFGSEAGAAAQIIMNGTDRLSTFTAELNNAQGAAEDMAAIMGGGLVNAQKALGSATDETILSLNDYLGINEKATSIITTLTDVVLDVNYALRYSQNEIAGLGDISDVVIESLKVFIKTIHAGYTVSMQMAHAAQFLVQVLNTEVSLSMFEDIANHARWANHQIEGYQTQHNQFLAAINRDGRGVRATYAEMDKELNAVIGTFDRMHRASLKPVTVTPSVNQTESLYADLFDPKNVEREQQAWIASLREFHREIGAEIEADATAKQALIEQQALMERKWREQAFVEQQTLTAGINEYEVSVQSLGDAWARTGNQALDAMGSMMSMLGTLADNEKAHQSESAKIAALRAKNDATFARDSVKWKANDAKLTRDQMQLDKQRISQSIAGSAGMLSAASAMYKEGSKEAKIAHQAALAMHAVDMAMKMKEAIANATVATTAAGALPPPLGFASVAAMSVLMGGVLSNIGASFSGGSSTNIPQAASGNELGALGGGGSAETLAKTQQLLDTNIDQYRELTAIRDASQKTANSLENLLGTAFKTGDMRNLTAPGLTVGRDGNIVTSWLSRTLSPLSAIDGLTGGLIGDGIQSLFGSKTSLTGARLEISGMLDDVMVGGFQDFKKSSKWKSTKRWTTEIGLDQTLTDGIAYTLGTLGDQMSESAKLLGKNIDDDFARLNVVIGNIDMTGKPEEVMKRLQTAFGEQADYMAQTLFPELLQYQKLMESQAEAVTRISMQKHIIDDVSASFNVVFDDAVRVSQVFDQVAGGFEAFTQATQTLQDAFFDDQRKQEENLRKLNNVLAQQGLLLPATREQYLQLAESFYALGEAGAELYMAMGNAADMADKYYRDMERLATESARVAEESLQSVLRLSVNAQSAAYRDLQTAITSEKSVLSNALNDYVSSLSDERTAINSNISMLRRLASSLDSAYKSIYAEDVSLLSYRRAQEELMQASASGQPLSASIDKSLSIVSGDTSSLYADRAAYLTDKAFTASAILSLSKVVGDQVSEGDLLLSVLDAQIGIARSEHQVNLAALDAQLDYYRDAIEGSSELLSVAVAIERLEIAMLGVLTDIAGATSSTFDQLAGMDGLVDWAEFNAAFDGLATEATLQNVFTQLDINGDRYIDATEALLVGLQGSPFAPSEIAQYITDTIAMHGESQGRMIIAQSMIATGTSAQQIADVIPGWTASDVLRVAYESLIAKPINLEPPATQPPATQPPATQPPVTQPPVTQPPSTQPPVSWSDADVRAWFDYNPNHTFNDVYSAMLANGIGINQVARVVGWTTKMVEDAILSIGGSIGAVGYAKGGMTPNVGLDEVVGVVHGGEYVAPNWQLNRHPELFAVLEAERAKKPLPGYANGGLVGVKSMNRSSLSQRELGLSDVVDQIKQTNRRLDKLDRIADSVMVAARYTEDHYKLAREWNWRGLPETRALSTEVAL